MNFKTCGPARKVFMSRWPATLYGYTIPVIFGNVILGENFDVYGNASKDNLAIYASSSSKSAVIYSSLKGRIRIRLMRETRYLSVLLFTKNSTIL